MTEYINPYVAGAPVTDQRMFFGREDVFTWIEQNIGGQFSDNMLVIHGQRRVGKTSVLKQLGNHLPDTYIPVFFDFQGRTHTTINRFLYRLAREVVRTLSREHGIKMPRPDEEAFNQDPEHFAGVFLAQVREALGERNLVLVFDEFDTLEERTARDMLGQYLVPYFSRMVHGAERLNFIFSIGSSGHKLEDMRAEYTDFFRVGLYKRISFLNPAEARHLITEPVRGVMEYEDQAAERIVEITSGHPYFTQLLCHELFARAQRIDDWHIHLADVEEVLPDVIERGTVNLKFVWDVASSTERYTLAALAEMGREASKEEILSLLQENKVRISGEEIGQALLELTARDVLSERHSFTVELLRLWLLENRPLKRVIEELAEKHPVAVRFTQIAEEYQEQDLVEQALENYHSALAAAPNYIPARLGVAEIYQESGRWMEAVEAYQGVLEIEAQEERAKAGLCETLVALGDAARERDDVPGAIQRYQEGLEIEEEHIEARERLAAIYLSQSKEMAEQSKWQRAGESLLEAWKYIPKGLEVEGQTVAPVEIAHLAGVEQLEQALAPLRKALAAMRAQLAQEQLIRAVKLREGEQYSAALIRLERALAYEPDLEEIQQEIKLTREAEREEGGEKIYTAGQHALRAQRWGEATSTFQRYLELEPEDPKRVEEVEGLIEEARLQAELAERYAAARQAIERGVTGRAMSLLREIRDLADGYRDVEQLFDQVRTKWWGKVLGRAALWGIGAVVLGLIGFWLLRPGGMMQPAAVGMGLYDNTPTATGTATSTPTPTATPTAIPPTNTPTPTLPPSPTPTPTPIPLAWQRLTSAQFIERDTVTAIVIDPNDPDVWYVGTSNGGIYKSINGGISWLPAQNGLGRAKVDTLIIDPEDSSTLYAGLIIGGVYKTTDGGQSWQSMNKDIETSGWQDISVIVMDPQNSQHLFYVNGWGFYETEDGAESWNAIDWTSVVEICGILMDVSFSPLDSKTLFMLVGSPGGDCGGVYKSTDGGITWATTELANIETYWSDLWVDNVTGEYVYAYAASHGEFYRSSDGGNTWQEGTSRECNKIVFHPEDGAIAYCLQGGNLKRTTNGGQSWQEIGGVDINSSGSIILSPHDPNTIMVGGDGLFISTDGGYTWEERSSGLGASRIELYVNSGDSSSLYMAEGEEGGLYRSSDSGNTWELINDLGSDLAFDADGQTLYQIARDLDIDGGVIIISHNGGSTWERSYLPSSVEYIHTITAHPLVSGMVYVNVVPVSPEDNDSEYYSTDGGTTWEKATGCDSLSSPLVFDPTEGSVAYGVAGPGGVCKSLDGGETWRECRHDTLGWSPDSDSAMLIDPRDSERLFMAKQGQGVAFSKGGCDSWFLYNNNGLGNLFVNTLAIDPQNPDTIYAGTDNGAYVSFDGGELWAPINDGLLGGLVVYSIVVDEESNVYAATPLGIFKLEGQ